MDHAAGGHRAESAAPDRDGVKHSSFTRYVALGDSISIDYYPARETGVENLGAASLLYKNHDQRWPAYAGRDLAHLEPGIAFDNLTADGATTQDVLERQLRHVDATTEPVLVTLTAGGNDMLMNLRTPGAPRDLPERIIERLEKILAELARKLPNALTIIGTVYDPSDGTNELYGERLDREAEWLARVNAAIRAAAGPSVVVADIHKEFMGHGLTAPPAKRWYWEGLIFEPNARGASEVRRLWLEAIGR